MERYAISSGAHFSLHASDLLLFYLVSEEPLPTSFDPKGHLVVLDVRQKHYVFNDI
jgi:hypothetical protein